MQIKTLYEDLCCFLSYLRKIMDFVVIVTFCKKFGQDRATISYTAIGTIKRKLIFWMKICVIF